MTTLYGNIADYIIITNDELKPVFQQLAEWKTKKGTPTLIVTTSQIEANYGGTDLAEKIRNYLKDAWENWGDGLYVLLGGDTEIIPERIATHETWQGQTYHRPTDLYFADVRRAGFQNYNWNANGNHIYGEIDDGLELGVDNYTGRASVESISEAQTFVDKVIYSEKQNNDYVNNVLLLGAFVYPNSWPAGQAYHSTIYNNYLPYNINGWRIFDDYQTSANNPYLGDEELNRANVISALNDGGNSNLDHFYIVSHLDHGSDYVIGTSAQTKGQYTNRSDMDNLINSPFYQIMFTVACGPNIFNNDCFGEHYINNNNGGGGAFMGNAGFGWSNTWRDEIEGFFDGVYQSINNDIRLGHAFQSARDNTYSSVGKRNLNLLGDPEMPIWTNTPQTMDVVVTPSSITNGQTTVSVTINNLVLDVDATVCLQKEYEDYAYQTVTGTGNPVQVDFIFTPDTPGDLDVTVTAHNYIPEERVIPVTLTNYAHLYVTDETYDDDNTSPSIGNDDGQVDAGETIELTITLTNSGDIAANNVSATISTSSSYLNITQNQSGYGNIASSASASSQTAYVFEVDKDTPSGEYVEFTLDMQDAGSNTYADNFYIQVGAPELEMVNNVIDDANANGTIDPGETISLYINLFNSGDAEATDVSATLTSTSPFVTNISQGFQYYDNISSQNTVSNTQPFIFEVSSSYAGETLDFHLAITNTYGRQWDYDFNLDVPQTVDGSSMKFNGYLTSIDIWWDKVDNIRGYNVYRSDTENGLYTKINTFVIEGTSYYKDTGLAELTKYYYKVSTVSSSGNESILSAPLQAWTTLSFLSGWPITPDKAGKAFSVTAEDVDNDGDKEIFAGNDLGVLLGWNPDAEELFDIDNNPTSISGFYDFDGDGCWSTPAITDINQDGKNEIVVTTRYGGANPGHLYVFISEDNDADSKPDIVWDTQVGNACLFGAAISDLNGDGYKEVIVHPTDANPDFYVFNHDGSNYPGWPKPVNTNGTGANYSVPAIADLDGDGYKEIIEGFRDGKLYIWKHDGSDFSSNPFKTVDDLGNSGFQFSMPPVVADIDKDGIYEIIVMTTKGGSNQGYIYIVDINGDLKSGWNGSADNKIMTFQETTHTPHTPPAVIVADYDQNGELDILCAYYQYLKVWDASGNEKLSVNNQSVKMQNPLVADVDGYGDMEIIVTAGNNKIYAYKSNGDLVLGWPLQVSASPSEGGTPTIADIDQDGLSEFLCTDDGGSTYIWQTQGNPALIDWGHFHYDNQNTGLYEEQGICGNITVDQTWSGTINVRGDITINDNVTLTIQPGTEIIFQDGDVLKSGTDPNKSEIIVQGELIANGTALNRIVFNSSTSWYGIVVESYAEVEISYSDISHAKRGVYLKPQLELPWLQRTISNCQINNCEYGVYLSSNNVTISNSTINYNNLYSIYSISGNVTCNDNTINNSETGIYLYDSQFTIYDNTISSNRKYGLYLSNSSDGYVTNNLMNLNSAISTEHDEVYAAIFLYNSSPFILSNHIYSNYKNGILLMNNSFPVIRESNLISINGPVDEGEEPLWKKAEICCRDYCVPYINYGHNDIIDDRTNAGYLMMHAGEIEEKIDVSGNYWGSEGSSPEGRLYPEDYFLFDDWDTEPNATGEPGGRDGEEQLFVEGLTAEEQGDFNLAKTKYNQIINQFPDSLETALALPRLLICEKELGGDLLQLENFYTSFSQNISDSAKSKVAYNLSRRCEVQQMLLNDAIVGYEQIVQSPPTLSDSVYAVIDIGDVYVLQDELANNGTLPKLVSNSMPENPELKPKDQKKFEEKKQELLSLLYKSSIKENKGLIPKVYALAQNYPNPFNPVTTIKYQLPKASKVRLEIFNILGQKVRTLIDNQKEAAYYELQWDGSNDWDRQSASGIYIYRLSAKALDGSKNFVKNRKMLLIR